MWFTPVSQPGKTVSLLPAACSNEGPVQDSLVGRPLLYRWPSVGWCVSLIKEAGKDNWTRGTRLRARWSTFTCTTRRRRRHIAACADPGGGRVWRRRGRDPRGCFSRRCVRAGFSVVTEPRGYRGQPDFLALWGTRLATVSGLCSLVFLINDIGFRNVLMAMGRETVIYYHTCLRPRFHTPLTTIVRSKRVKRRRYR